MDKAKVAVTARRMMEARAALLRDNPFFGNLAFGLTLACAPCETACTDGTRLIFDPEFAETLKTDREMEFVMLHELLHCVLEHCTRGGSRDHELFNLACDIVVNSTILEMWGMDTFRLAGMVPFHLTPDGREGRDFSAEEVYHMLLNAGYSPPSGGQLDRHDTWQGMEDQELVRDKWDRMIRRAAESCPDGGLTSTMRALVDELLSRSRVDWRQLLHDFLQYDTFDYTFRPPDRRFSDSDFFLPAFNIDEDDGNARNIWVCVDTSGSISDEQLAEAIGEILDAMRQTGLTGMVSFFDHNITDPEPFTDEAEFRKILPTGGGGTNFHLIFQYLREHLTEELPKAILIFTDGQVWSWPEEEDALGVPVLWLICKDGNTDVPWGQWVQV